MSARITVSFTAHTAVSACGAVRRSRGPQAADADAEAQEQFSQSSQLDALAASTGGSHAHINVQALMLEAYQRIGEAPSLLKHCDVCYQPR